MLKMANLCTAEKNAPQGLWFLHTAWNTGDPQSGVGIHKCVLFLTLVNSELVYTLSES